MNIIDSNLKNLLELSDRYWREKKWDDLELICQKIIKELTGKENSSYTLKFTVIKYLGSLFKEHNILYFDSEIKNEIKHKIFELSKFVEKNYPTQKLNELISPVEEILILSTKNNAQNRNIIGKNLRKIARPDLCIEIVSENLKISKLNYITRIIRAAAFADLGDFDQAISDAIIALKVQNSKDQQRSHTVLSRAYRERYKKFGDFEDRDSALEHARSAYDIDINMYTKNVLIAALVLFKEYEDLQIEAGLISSQNIEEKGKNADDVLLSTSLDIMSQYFDED